MKVILSDIRPHSMMISTGNHCSGIEVPMKLAGSHGHHHKLGQSTTHSVHFLLKDKKRLQFRIIHLIEFIQSNNFHIYSIF